MEGRPGIAGTDELETGRGLSQKHPYPEPKDFRETQK